MKKYNNFMIEYNEEEFIRNIKYGLIAVDKDESKRYDGDNILFYHFCGYLEQPNHNDKINLYNELKTDKDFKLDNIDDIVIIDAPNYVVEYFKNL